MSGAAGPGGIDSVVLQDWLLYYGTASRLLQESVARFVHWIANTFPPWAAIRVYVAGRLIGLDKCPGVQPVGIGEVCNDWLGKQYFLYVLMLSLRHVAQDSYAQILDWESREEFTSWTIYGVTMAMRMIGAYCLLM
eukprot:5752559-Ditylum_brightwellii.AAC.1